MIKQLAQKIANMITRGDVTRVDASYSAQVVQVAGAGDEVFDRVELLGTHGITARPPVGSECLLLSPLGSRSLVVAICAESRQHRPRDLEPGEVALYTLDGVRVICKEDGIVEIGTSPSDYAALASKVDERIQTLEQWCTNHTHPFVGVSPGSPGTALVSIPPPTPGTSCAASEVMVK